MSKLDDRNAAIKLVQGTKPEKAAKLAAAKLALTPVNTVGKKRVGVVDIPRHWGNKDRHKPGYMTEYMRKYRAAKKK